MSKYTIAYRRGCTESWPYVAYVKTAPEGSNYDDMRNVTGVSDTSYEEAKQRVLEQLRWLEARLHENVPPPSEEVELNG